MKHPLQLNWALKTKLKLDDTGKFSFEVRYFGSASSNQSPGRERNVESASEMLTAVSHLYTTITTSTRDNLLLPFQELTFHVPRQDHICTGSMSPSPQPNNPYTDDKFFLYNTICKTNTSKQKGSNSSTTGFTGMTTSCSERAEWGRTLNIYSWVLSLD